MELTPRQRERFLAAVNRGLASHDDPARAERLLWAAIVGESSGWPSAPRIDFQADTVQRPWRSIVKTRCKFYVSSLELLPGQGAGVKVHLHAVGRGDRNASWAAATPIGDMHMTVNNPAAAEQWEAFMQEARATGKQPEVFIDIYPATDGWAGDGHKFRPGTGESGTSYDERYCGECGNQQDATMRSSGDEEPQPVHPNG